jgi:hypothetical protein
VTASLVRAAFVRPSPRLCLCIAWGVLLLALSYKRKILGEEGVRPCYFSSIVVGYLVMAWLVAKYSLLRRLRFRSSGGFCVISQLYGLIAYIAIQSTCYPESVRPMLYTTATVFLVFTLAVLSIYLIGWHGFILAFTRLLLWYGLLNVMLVLAQCVWPERLGFMLVPFNESGYGVRICGLPGDPTHLGSFLAIAILLWFVQRRNLSVWWRLAVPVLLATMIATGSRNAILSLLVGGTVSTLVGSRGREVRFIKLCIFMFVIGLLTLWALISTEYGLKFLADSYRFDDENAYSRLNIWQDVFCLAGSLPLMSLLFGSGYLFIQDNYGSPYNALIRICLNHGVFFAAFFMLIVAELFFLGLKDREALRRQTVLALLAYWFSFSMFLDTAFAEFFHITELCFWLASALVVTHRIYASEIPLGHRSSA